MRASRFILVSHFTGLDLIDNGAVHQHCNEITGTIKGMVSMIAFQMISRFFNAPSRYLPFSDSGKSFTYAKLLTGECCQDEMMKRRTIDGLYEQCADTMCIVCHNQGPWLSCA
jgi:hypothetical protein